MKSIRLFRIGTLILGLCCLHAVGNGQSNDQGQIRGTVSDSRGAVIAGATVTLTDVGTNVSEKTTANDHGLYVFTALRAANYRMLIESSGFGPVEKAGIALDVNQQTTLNVTLSPAAANAYRNVLPISAPRIHSPPVVSRKLAIWPDMRPKRVGAPMTMAS